MILGFLSGEDGFSPETVGLGDGEGGLSGRGGFSVTGGFSPGDGGITGGRGGSSTLLSANCCSNSAKTSLLSIIDLGTS